jgi:hypothetical protein
MTAIDQLNRMIELARAGFIDALATDPGVTVRGSIAELALDADSGPTLAELEAVLGPARGLPRMPGPAYSTVTFDGHRPLALFAHIDDATGRAVELAVRRDSV